MSLNSLTVAELKALAEKEEVEVTSAMKKADIIAALNDAGIESVDDATSEAAPAPKAEKAAEPEPVEVTEQEYIVKAKPELDDEMAAALRERNAKSAQRPAFRRHEWFRYKKLGGKHAPWRAPTGIHSKQRRHFKYRPNVVSIGYRGPVAARGLHPSGFEEVLVYRPEDLAQIEPKTQAARIGGTVGGKKREAIHKAADSAGIRILNRRQN